MVHAETPQHLAVVGDIDGLETYLSEGGDVNAKDDHGDTALMKACMSGHPEVVEFLLGKGATPISNDKGFAPGEQYAMDVTASTKAEISALLSKKLGSRPTEMGLSSRSKRELVEKAPAADAPMEDDAAMLEESTACACGADCTVM
ncbi:unnamed protein product [Heterosigma akashiwo]